MLQPRYRNRLQGGRDDVVSVLNASGSALGRVTIQDVAVAAGVSTGTVSRVLNERPGVREATRARVLATIARLEYHPDHAARALSRQPMRVGLSVASGSRRLTPFFMLFLEHLIAELQQDGYRLEEIPCRPDGLPAHLTDGLILHGAPFVLIGHAAGVLWVMPDDRDGGLQATRHLLRLGHTEIAHLGGLMSHQAFQDRYQGYLDAHEEAGLPTERTRLLDGDFTALGAYRAVRRALESGVSFSAIFAASDEMAVGAIAALSDVGLSVPLDVSVVGFDDLPEVSAGVPLGLTTVRQDIAALAATAVTLLKEGLRGGPPRGVTLPVQLVVRGTTARQRR
jgi:LacI family transcriptional regulator